LLHQESLKIPKRFQLQMLEAAIVKVFERVFQLRFVKVPFPTELFLKSVKEMPAKGTSPPKGAQTGVSRKVRHGST